MIRRVLLIQWVMFALVSDSSARDAPRDRYGQIPSGPGADAVDVVPDSRPLLPPAGPVDRGPSRHGQESAPLVSPVETSPPSTTPPDVAAESARASRDSAPPRQEMRDVRQPAPMVRPPAGATFRDAPSSTGAHNDQFLTAQQWIAELLAEPAEGALVGQPITLLDALRGIRDERRQQEIIDAYWRLSQSVANYHVAMQVLGVAFGESIGPGSTRSRSADRFAGQLRLDVAREKLATVEAQADLAALIPWSENVLPLPANLPHVGTYRTRYDEIFASRPNRPALRLHFLLPAQADVLRAHAEMLNVLASDTDGEVADLFREQCREFTGAVYQYNRNIAHYVLLATNDGDGADLVPMLIKVERTETNPSDVASNVVRAMSTQEPGEPDVERSVLVRPAEETNLVPIRDDAVGPTVGNERLKRQPHGDQSAQPGHWQKR